MVDAWNLTVLQPLPYTITSNVGVTDPDNLKDPQPGIKASIAAGTQAAPSQLTIDLGASKAVRQFFLGYYSALGAETWRIEVGPTADFLNLTLDTGWIAARASTTENLEPAGYKHAFYHREAGSVSGRYVRISLQHAAVRTAGILAIGNVVQPEFNSDYGDTQWGFEEADDPELLDSGVEVLVERTPTRVFEFRLSWLSQLEMDRDWEPLGRLAVQGSPVLVARDPRSSYSYRHQGLYWGRLRLTPLVAQDFDMYEVNGVIRSMV